MTAEIDTRVRGARTEETRADKARALRLRRLWRSHDTTLQSSGLALGRPVLTSKAATARRDTPQTSAGGLTARELINMARAARRDRACPAGLGSCTPS
jgi:hypothetical protein